ncbi:unnamed protein product [Spirodela intermedia]|uniref:Uncharacterized protein n=1 Tax=Spirodela intermedia TaxID=51605 RepID=A0A7I8KD43_SPIIN|nr:unnamed protein product [Spirodela intermedia]
MERTDKQPIFSAQRNKIEPTFVPEWLKSTSSSSNQISGSSFHSDDRAIGILSRNRPSVNGCEHDSPRSSVTAERNLLSHHRSSSTNGSPYNDRERPTHPRPYSSFGRSNRDRDRDKDAEFVDKQKLCHLENGCNGFPDLSLASRSEKDALKRSQTMISGRYNDSWNKAMGNGTAYARSSASIVNNISKASFERDFPSLGTEEKQGSLEIGRVSSPSLSSAVQNLPLGSALIGGDGWTSALAEVPVIVGCNGPQLTSMQQATPTSASSTTLSTTSGLNMAEALVQAPPQTRTIPKLSVDTQRLEEFAIKQSRQLVPVTPSTSKASVLSSSEKLKPKVSRSGDFGTLSKAGQQSSLQLVGHNLRASSRPDISKPSHVGNFHVLNRERNGISPTARDGQSPMNTSRVNPAAVAATTAFSLKRSNSPLLKTDGRGTGLPVTTFIEKRPPITQQNRSEFFNSLRKKTSAGSSSSTTEQSSSQSPALQKPDGQEIVELSSMDGESKGASASDSRLELLTGNRSSSHGTTPDPCEDSQSSSPSNGEKGSCLDPEEEERLLRLFGWKENTGEEEEALTAEEIDAFIEEYQKLRPSSKFTRRNLHLPEESSDGNSGLSSKSS